MTIHQLEKNSVIFFNKPKSKLADRFSAFVSNVTFLVLAWILIALSAVIHDLISGFFVAVGLAMVFLLHFAISEGVFKWGAKKLNIERKRPYIAYPQQIRGIGKQFGDSAFPSSHVAAMTGGLFVLVTFYKILLIPAFLVVLIMGLSRLRNGMHYPSDIIAGVVLGLIYGWSAMQMMQLIIKHLI